MFWRKKRIRYFQPMQDREMMEALAVEDEEPLLRAVVHMLHGNSLRLAEQAGLPSVRADVAKGLAMASSAVEDACDELLETVEKARRKRAGMKEE